LPKLTFFPSRWPAPRIFSYIGQVDYSTEPDDLQALFSQAGTVARVSIPPSPWTGGPQGFAYLEFTDATAQQKAVELFNGFTFKGRELKVGSAAGQDN
jgi:polyadenylate-binding protein 2